MTALARFLVRCEHDALPGFCCRALCDHFDWRDNDDQPIDRPLSQEEIGALLGVTRQRVAQIEASAMAMFAKRLRHALDFDEVKLPRHWWRAATAIPRSERAHHQPSTQRQIAERAKRARERQRAKDRLGRWRQSVEVAA